MASYHLRLAHLYGDLLNTYGDVGNITALKYYAQQMDTEIDVQVISIENDFDPDQFDLAFFGGGQDYEQMIVSQDIQTKKAAIEKFIDDEKPMLAICGGYQLLGHYYIGANGEKIQGIGVLDHYTLSQDNHRFIGDIEIKNELTGEIYHGFENHNGRTFIDESERPLGKVVSGNGNNGEDQTEGAIYKQTYCTYFHGPILTRNGQLAKRILLQALRKKYPTADFSKQEALEIKPTF
ncbi:glutamine amidotransferase [Limosilactobacillus gastricus]|uniref:Lipid II isoglutaminyl synthase (glutamine-hydrolyzing) subunit GatD n=1 Tax=Limosilactobacillus gastricus DSM 16045 TaxID=1423749 RepID=A0A0R1VD46_9LACO|nr:glutamine amidotransferase [Limosilactobacillus gastricus]KRM03421.1 putative cobyric acid synthase [Limosilactobacillus gastricus DSM 16045]QGF40872.1 glutamine amidotransferase [Limosilactobacillus gastricus]